MEKTPTTLLSIRQRLPELTGNYKKIADGILMNPEQMLQLKLNDLAGKCRCDTAQVIRFCQKFGFSGFSELKKQLTAELIASPRTLHRQLDASASTFDRMVFTIGQNLTRTINDTLERLTEKNVVKAGALISAARHILICGVGSSSLAAQDLQIKLMRLGITAMFHADPELCKLATASLGPDDLAIFISFGGESAAVIENIRIAKKHQTPILALTNYSHSTLARNADCVLYTTADEEHLRLGAMDSITAQYLVNMVLISFLAGKYPEETEQRMIQLYSDTRPYLKP